jgi:hypothetical protein
MTPTVHKIVVVCGPPGSGKSEFVEQRRTNDALTWHMDSIAMQLGNFAGYPRPDDVAACLLAMRDGLLSALTTRRMNRDVYLIVTNERSASAIAMRLGAELVSCPIESRATRPARSKTRRPRGGRLFRRPSHG